MTDIQTTRFVRKPLHVDALQVTDENMAAVAEWCGGVLRKQGHRWFIHLFLKAPRTPRQSVAYRGDWVTKVGPTFKAWTNKKFRETFDPDKHLGVKASAIIIDELYSDAVKNLLSSDVDEPVSGCSRENCTGCYLCYTIDYNVRGKHVATSEPVGNGYRITPTTP